jgi:aminomethyltransferase
MAAQRRDLVVLFDDNPHRISLRGSLVVDYLNPLVLAIRDLAFFGHMHTTLFGVLVPILCSGFTGERGYEILRRGQDTALDLLNAENYLLLFPFNKSENYPVKDEP